MAKPIDLGTFKSQNLRAAETMARLAYGHSISQHGGWGFLIAGMIFAITFFATRDWALALNLPV
jgi:hypothetical protein